jgi:hypothetical protein
MEIQEAKVAKANAKDRIVKILEDLEHETGMKVLDIEYIRKPLVIVHGDTYYDRSVRLILEL